MFLVTGATGNVGGHVVRELAAAGQPVRALTRHPERAGFPGGVAAVRGDLTDPQSLDAALDGVRRVFLFPVADAALAPVHEADIAAVATAALLHDGHAGQRYELTGPQSLTHREQVLPTVEQVTGRPARTFAQWAAEHAGAFR